MDVIRTDTMKTDTIIKQEGEKNHVIQHGCENGEKFRQIRFFQQSALSFQKSEEMGAGSLLGFLSEFDSMDDQLSDQGYPALCHCGGAGTALGAEALSAGDPGTDPGHVGLHVVEQPEGTVCGWKPCNLPDALFGAFY